MNKDNEFMKQLVEVRPVTRNLIEAVMLDAWPHHAAVVDFGIDSQKHYEALYYPIRQWEIMPKALDLALGHGENLTALVRQSPSNPHKDVQFYTSWDVMFGRPQAEGAGSQAEKFNRILDDKAPPQAPGREKGIDGIER